MAVNYDVPMIFTERYIDGLERLLNYGEDKIKSVYGSTRFGFLGQARYSEKIPDLDINDLHDYVLKIKKLNVEFHYTFNSPWTNLKERNQEYKKQILNDLKKITEIGVDTFIVANPYLISLIRQKFPEIKIIASINLQTTTAYKFKSLIEYGCNSVVLDRPVNRNIAFLEKIKSEAEKFSLLVNSTCLFDCPIQQYHSNENGYLSSENIDNVEDKEYCINYCLPLIEKHPENILKSTWIRPEDIDKYEKIGVKNFKIQGRTLESDILLNLVKAYLDRKTPNDDLFYIFPDFAAKYPALEVKFKNSRINKMKFVEYFFKNNINCSIDCFSCNHCHKTFEKLCQ